jgi:hypothetical protein
LRGAGFASLFYMSRVEPKTNEQAQRDEPAQSQRRDAVDRTPSKAEGDEATIDQALENDDAN